MKFNSYILKNIEDGILETW